MNFQFEIYLQYSVERKCVDKKFLKAQKLQKYVKLTQKLQNIL